MYLEHVNLVVADMDAMLHFYRAAFPHWRIRDEGAGEWYGKPRKWLHFGDDYHYLAQGSGRQSVVVPAGLILAWRAAYEILATHGCFFRRR